jgi:linoleoyl-CoA desaturase
MLGPVGIGLRLVLNTALKEVFMGDIHPRSAQNTPAERNSPPNGLLGRAPMANRVKFAATDEFHQELKRRVKRYFDETGLKRRDCPRMYTKTALIFGALATVYVALVFFVATWWLALPLAVLVGLLMAAVGFNIQHDGGHRAYSDSRCINNLMAMTLDLLGGSSYIWAQKHNVIHHTYANISGHDDDINMGFLGRLSPHQRRQGYHRLQHYYLWALYGLLPIKWQVYDDFRDIFTGRIGRHRFARPKGWDLVTLIGGKVVFLSLAVVVPLLWQPAWAVLVCYATASIVQGVTLGVVFQLAHCVEEADFPLPEPETGKMEAAWAVHQIQTTVDFSRTNSLVSWLVGGLNFQIEHHLFPRICHIHYPALAPVVEMTCRDFGFRYLAHKSFLAGVRSHFRWLRRMGTADV